MNARSKYLALIVIFVITFTAVLPIGIGGSVAKANSPSSIWFQNFESVGSVGVGNPTNASAAIVNDNNHAGGTKAVKLTNYSEGWPGNTEAYIKIVPQSGATIDITAYNYINIYTNNTRPSNDNFYIWMYDVNGNTAGVWSPDSSSISNTWTKISLSLSSITPWNVPLDLSKIKEIWIGQWNPGVFYFDDIYLSVNVNDNIPAFDLTSSPPNESTPAPTEASTPIPATSPPFISLGIPDSQTTDIFEKDFDTSAMQRNVIYLLNQDSKWYKNTGVFNVCDPGWSGASVPLALVKFIGTKVSVWNNNAEESGVFAYYIDGVQVGTSQSLAKAKLFEIGNLSSGEHILKIKIISTIGAWYKFDRVDIYNEPAPITSSNLTSLTVANPLTNPSLTLSLDSLQSSGYSYQIWSYEEYGKRSSDGSDGDSGAYWRLVKGYGDNFSTGITNGSATETWQVKGALGQTYKIFIRAKDSGGSITQLTKEFSSKDVGMVRINSILLDNNIPVATTYKKANQNLNISVLAEGDGPLTYEYYFDNQKINGAAGASYDYTIPSDCEQGYHTIKVKVSNSNDFDEMSVNIYVTNDTNGYVIPEISSFSLNQTAVVGDQVTMTLGDKAVYGIGVDHIYQIGEPGRGYFRNSSLNTYTFQYPGVYQVFGSVRNTNAKSFSDGAIKYITVSRTAGDTANAIKLNASDVQIKNLQTLGTVTPGSIAANTQLQFNADAKRSNVQYSFWRLDARGYRLVQDWSTQNSLNWTPTQPGNYTISVRVRDAAYHYNNASYEAAQSYNFNVTGCTNNTSAISIVTPVSMVKRTPVAITANATAPDVGNLLYRFEISDSFMGTYTVQDYSLSNTCTWIPRKAGDYKIIVRVRDQGSYGYYDSYQTKDVTVTDQ